MDLKDTAFEQLLLLVKQLPDEKRATLKAVLKTPPSARKNKSKIDFKALLLAGPVMDSEQFKTFRANREKFDMWRKK